MIRFATVLPRLLVLAPLMLAGCASGSDPVNGLVSGIGLLPEQPEAKDFVKAARPDPDKIDYLPVGFEPPQHKLPVRSKEEAAADDRALQAAAGQVPAVKPKAEKTAPKKPKTKKHPELEPDSDIKPTQN